MSLQPQVLSFLRTWQCSGICNDVTITIVVKGIIVEGHTFAYLVFFSREKRFNMV